MGLEQECYRNHVFAGYRVLDKIKIGVAMISEKVKVLKSGLIFLIAAFIQDATSESW